LNNSPFYTFFGAFFTNLISEFGDRTFIIAAIMAARYNRAAVFLGALLGNTGMSLIGTVIGGASPLLLN
jgi:putative Ca2+/H+ antiporter (TMEM165/GDT1 family)